ncbi:hypothetical protein [Candidatus Avelusimicrobium luingense]
MLHQICVDNIVNNIANNPVVATVDNTIIGTHITKKDIDSAYIEVIF